MGLEVSLGISVDEGSWIEPMKALLKFAN